jgi:hypothetical protein
LPDVGRSDSPPPAEALLLLPPAALLAPLLPADRSVGIEEPAVFRRRGDMLTLAAAWCAVMATSPAAAAAAAAEELVGRDLGGLAARGMLRVGEFSRRMGEMERIVRACCVGLGCGISDLDGVRGDSRSQPGDLLGVLANAGVLLPEFWIEGRSESELRRFFRGGPDIWPSPMVVRGRASNEKAPRIVGRSRELGRFGEMLICPVTSVDFDRLNEEAFDRLDGLLSRPCFDLLNDLQTDVLSESSDCVLLPFLRSPNFLRKDELFEFMLLDA